MHVPRPFDHREYRQHETKHTNAEFDQSRLVNIMFIANGNNFACMATRLRPGRSGF